MVLLLTSLLAASPPSLLETAAARLLVKLLFRPRHLITILLHLRILHALDARAKIALGHLAAPASPESSRAAAMATSAEDFTARFFSRRLMASKDDALVLVSAWRFRRRFLRKACLKDLVLVLALGPCMF
jgi:hypothetical protein